MDKSSGIFIVFALLFAGVLIMGCSSSDSSSSGSTAQPSVTATTASQAALYSAGDIVKNPKSTSTSALLIIGYDAGSNTYERAYIYPNSDGSWGYRIDAKTEKISRSTIEKVYSQKVTSKAVASVPIGTPTTKATPTPVYTTSTTSATATVTTTSGPAPRVMSVDPDTGKTGTTVSITNLKGTGFQTGTAISFVSGSSYVNASSITFSSSNLMTCNFVIPSDATVGYWDVLVKNPDGQSHQFKNGFHVTQGTSTTSTTKTSTTSSSSTTTTTTTKTATLTSVSPNIVATGGSEALHTLLVITGTNFGSVSNIKLTKIGSNTISGQNYWVSSTSGTNAQANFDFPAGSNGRWTVTVVDSSGNVLASLSNGLTVN